MKRDLFKEIKAGFEELAEERKSPRWIHVVGVILEKLVVLNIIVYTCFGIYFVHYL